MNAQQSGEIRSVHAVLLKEVFQRIQPAQVRRVDGMMLRFVGLDQLDQRLQVEGVVQHLQQVIDLTREIYGGFSEVSVSIDPEVGDTHIIFHAPVDCSIDEALGMDERWDRRILQLIPRSPQVFLAFASFKS